MVFVARYLYDSQCFSSNGTFVNLEKIEKGVPTRLYHGDELSLILPRSRRNMFGESAISYVLEDNSNFEEAGHSIPKLSKKLKDLSGNLHDLHCIKVHISLAIPVTWCEVHLV